MNKELIKKYKREFDHWLNGGEVLAKYSGKYPDSNGWQEVPKHGCWATSDEQLIVINDEYVEFRKALAEGKVIQYSSCGGMPDSFEDMRQIDYFNRNVNHYRIKPDESKFKIGDWIKSPCGSIGKIYSFPSPGHAQFSEVQEHGTSNINDWELWKPQNGEWVVVTWNSISEFTVIKWNFNIGSNCEPFIGALPDILKDKQWIN